MSNLYIYYHKQFVVIFLEDFRLVAFLAVYYFLPLWGICGFKFIRTVFVFVEMINGIFVLVVSRRS